MHDDHSEKHPGSTVSYVIGFLLSIVLTIIPLYVVLNHSFSNMILVYVIMIMAVLQFLIQLVFFMHIRESEEPHYNILAIALGIIFVFAIVAGSAWIMTFNSQVQ
ncbi:cytochrome o ubiquinol oxidase subunit IV [Tuberibacillus calidus]|uniref:cytochrome o ubiquinol oxidase subunit IV n=1 Tax=Tuberibacillus calidus TaxID=340097 RepID=UPI00042604C6|nr:cytochrome o ubiquinol oxidase subunit IV [Tuberibacillus calidus]